MVNELERLEMLGYCEELPCKLVVTRLHISWPPALQFGSYIVLVIWFFRIEFFLFILEIGFAKSFSKSLLAIGKLI